MFWFSGPVDSSALSLNHGAGMPLFGMAMPEVIDASAFSAETFSDRACAELEERLAAETP